MVAFQSLISYIKSKKDKKRSPSQEAIEAEVDESLIPGLETVPLLEDEDVSYKNNERLLATSDSHSSHSQSGKLQTIPEQRDQTPSAQTEDDQQLLDFSEDVTDGGAVDLLADNDDNLAQETFREEGAEVLVPVATTTLSQDPVFQQESQDSKVNPYLLELSQDLLEQEAVPEHLSIQPELQEQSPERSTSSHSKDLKLIPGYKEEEAEHLVRDSHLLGDDEAGQEHERADTDPISAKTTTTKTASALEQHQIQAQTIAALSSPEEEDSSSACR